MSLHTAYQSNELIDRLPKHLKQFIKPQDYMDYSPIDQAVWRYVMRKNVDYLAHVAHSSYIDGLQQTGIDIDEIPSMYGMNRILRQIGWAAVAVDGFIPPNAFMEFQAYKVLVIASDIRQLENIEYTPAPDIIHEAAGHAPIIANPDYAEYLRRLGDIGAKAILSRHDIALYEAVRKLSILKESTSATSEQVESAARDVERLQSVEVELSEMAQIRNLQWWSVEYGLIGELSDPKIYGAGLLSSIGESTWCMSEKVEKIPYSLEAAQREFDITKPQPQLYVTPDFSYLMEVLESFANSLSLRKGGAKGLQRLIESDMVGTIEINTGLQISGQFSRMIKNDDHEVIYFETTGPTALAYREKELIGHGISQHSHGFISPLGKLKNINLPIEDMGPYDLKAYNFYDNKHLSFEFESGIKVDGLNVTGIRNIQGKLMLIQLVDCTITYGTEMLVQPSEAAVDVAIGSKIISAFAGSADHRSFPNLYGSSPILTVQQDKAEEVLQLESHYADLRSIRKERPTDHHAIKDLWIALRDEHPDEWLLALEIWELAGPTDFAEEIRQHLRSIAVRRPETQHLIEDGMKLVQRASLAE